MEGVEVGKNLNSENTVKLQHFCTSCNIIYKYKSDAHGNLMLTKDVQLNHSLGAGRGGREALLIWPLETVSIALYLKKVFSFLFIRPALPTLIMGRL